VSAHYIKAKPDALVAPVLSCLDAAGFKTGVMHQRDESDGGVVVRFAGRREDICCVGQCVLTAQGGHSIVSVHVRPSRTAQVLLNLNTACGAIALCYVVVQLFAVLEASVKFATSVIGGCALIIGFGAGVGSVWEVIGPQMTSTLTLVGPLLVVVIAFLTHRKWEKRISLPLHCVENDLTSALLAYAPGSRIRPARLYVLSGWVSVPATILGSASLCYVAASMWWPMLVVILPFAAALCCYTLLAHYAAARSSRVLHDVYLGAAFRWVLCNVGVLVFALLLGAIDRGVPYAIAARSDDERLTADSALRRLTSAPQSGTGSDVGAKAALLHALIEPGTSVSVEGPPAADQLLRNTVKITTPPLLVLVIMVAVVYAVSNLRALLAIPRRWTEMIGSKMPTAPVLRDAGHEGSVPPVLSLVSLASVHVFGGVTNLLGAFASAECLSFVLSERALIWPGAASLLGWVPAITQELGRLTSTGDSNWWPFVWRAVIVLFCLPFLLLVCSYCIHLGGGLARFLTTMYATVSRRREIRQMAPLVAELSRTAGVHIPTLRVTSDTLIAVTVRPNWRGSRAVIQVSTGALERLSQQELRALLAHEIGHLRQGMGAIWWARFISRITLFPTCYMALVFDFHQREYEADELAARVCGGEDLTSALKKIAADTAVRCVLTASKPRDEREEWSLMEVLGWITTPLRRLYALMFRDEFVGYTHPPVELRITNVDAVGPCAGEV